MLYKIFIWIVLLGGITSLHANPHEAPKQHHRHCLNKINVNASSYHHDKAPVISIPHPGKNYPSSDMAAPLFENEENDDLKSSRKYLKTGPALAIIFLTEEYSSLNVSDHMAMYGYVQLPSFSFHQPAFLQVFRI